MANDFLTAQAAIQLSSREVSKLEVHEMEPRTSWLLVFNVDLHIHEKAYCFRSKQRKTKYMEIGRHRGMVMIEHTGIFIGSNLSL